MTATLIVKPSHASTPAVIASGPNLHPVLQAIETTAFPVAGTKSELIAVLTLAVSQECSFPCPK